MQGLRPVLVNELSADLLFIGFLSVAVLADLMSYKIPNVLLLFGLGTALVSRLSPAGEGAFMDMILGGLLPFAICFALFFFSMMGAGDIKLLMVTGMYVGAGRIISVMFVALVIAAVMAAAKAGLYGMLSRRMVYFRSYADDLRLYFSGGRKISRRELAYIKQEDKLKKEKWLMHLSLPIALAAVLEIFGVRL